MWVEWAKFISQTCDFNEFMSKSRQIRSENKLDFFSKIHT